MVEGNGDWLRARGIGRERFAGYLAEYLGSIGYRVERSELTEPMETHVTGQLEKMSPSVPPGRPHPRVPPVSHERRSGGRLEGSDGGPRRPEAADGPPRA